MPPRLKGGRIADKQAIKAALDQVVAEAAALAHADESATLELVRRHVETVKSFVDNIHGAPELRRAYDPHPTEQGKSTERVVVAATGETYDPAKHNVGGSAPAPAAVDEEVPV